MKNRLRKIRNYFREHSFGDTLKWLYNCVKFKIISRKVKSANFEKVEIEKNIKDYLTFKSSPSVYIVASIPYYDIGGGQRCSQLAKTFNKMGFDTHYLYAFESSESVKFDMEMPMSSHLFINKESIEKVSKEAKENDLFIFEAPTVLFKEILEIAKTRNCNIIYENIDNWETSLGATVYNEEMLVELLRDSKLLVGTAKPLVKQLKGYLNKYSIGEKPVLYLPNAVDEELFCGLKKCETPPDLVVDQVTLLYYGSLWGEWFDWDLIIDFAIRHPRYSFNIIGDQTSPTLYSIRNNCPHNIHFLGLKRQIELPAYLNHVDYTMIPFKPGAIGDYVSPLKIFEYISMYTRVLCTNLPDVQGYPNVYCGDNVDDWERIVEENHPVDKDAADAFSEANSWTSRVNGMIENIYGDFGGSMFKDKLSIVILNFNNKSIINKSINSLLRYNKYYSYDIIVVDNGSTDGSYEMIKEKFGNKIKVVRNEKNGCSSGRNLGVSQSERDFILFLDSDQWATNDYWLLPYETVIKKKSNVGLIGWAAGFFNSKNSAYHVVDSFPYRYMPQSALCRYDIGYLGSGGMLVSREDFDKVEGFDLAYDPTCYEDTDFSMKLRDLGKELYYCPYLGIIHLPHQTTNSGSEAHTKLIKEKQLYFTKKWETKNPSVFRYRK